MGVLSWLLVIFIVLKVLGVITWSWWTVFTPLYIEFILCLIAALLDN